MPYLSAQKAMLVKWKLKLGLATPRTPSHTPPAPSWRSEEGQPDAPLGVSNRRIQYPNGRETTGSDWNWFQPAKRQESEPRTMPVEHASQFTERRSATKDACAGATGGLHLRGGIQFAAKTSRPTAPLVIRDQLIAPQEIAHTAFTRSPFANGAVSGPQKYL